MRASIRISETEWEIMRVVWARHPISASQIVEALKTLDHTWHPKTARTLLARLVKKRALDYHREGRVHVYDPLVGQRECIAAASQSFLDRVFGGSLKPMLAFFAEQKKFTKRDLQELHELLDKAGPQTRRRR